MHKNTWY